MLVAVPGSGKTTVIISRIAYLIYCHHVPPEKILTVTFSVDAAKSMRKRYEDKFYDPAICSKLNFKTIHSLSYDIVKTYCRHYGKAPFKISSDNERIIRDLIKKEHPNMRNEGIYENIISSLSKSKNLMMKEEERSKIQIQGMDFNHIYSVYEKFKIDNRIMDFDDMLIYAYRVLKKYPAVLEKYQNMYDYFNVDEAQDNSLVQNRIMRLLSSKNNNLFMVGDEDQCIYGFRGAYPQAFFEFEEMWGKENILKLQTNYRSYDEILNTAERFISQNANRIEKKLKGFRGVGGNIELKDFNTIMERNNYICRDFSRYSDSAVLARNNDSFISIINSLLDNSVDFNIKAGGIDFYNSLIVRDILFFLKEEGNEPDSDWPKHLKSFLNVKHLVKHIRSLDSLSAIRFILNEMDYFRYIKSKRYDGCSFESSYLILNSLISIALSKNNINDFINRVKMINTICREGRSGGSITLLTCHGSKGLEFNKVYLIDVVDNVFPSQDTVNILSNIDKFDFESGKQEISELEEEVRLFYVALTRAKDEAELLNVKGFYPGNFSPSVFYKQIENIIRSRDKDEGKRLQREDSPYRR